nr:hypothetical protein [Tanacetum cinerariifolium]
MPLTKKKVKVDVTRGKGIELHSQAALTEDAQFEEVRRKSMRDFHKTHPSGSGTITKTTPSVANIKPSVTSGGTGVKPRVPNVAEEETFENNENELNSKHETDESESGSKSNHEDDEEEVKDEFVKTSSNNSDDKVKGDEDEEMDYTTSQLYDDVDIRLNAPVNTNKEFVQEERTDAKTEVPVTSSSHSSDLAVKFLNFSNILYRDVKIVSPMDVYIHHEVPNQGLKKRKTSKDVEPAKGSKAKESQSGSSKRHLKGTRSNYAELEYDFKECYKALLEKPDWENLEGDDYPFDLTKPLPLVMSIEDMVPNIWSPVKVGYDKHALWGISHWRDQRKTFYGCARGLQSKNDVYSTKRISTVTGYLQEIVVRRADNNLYKFKEGDFLRLHTNDIEDMILFVVHNRLINLSGDDVSDFAIALRMFTRSLANQKRVEDL